MNKKYRKMFKTGAVSTIILSIIYGLIAAFFAFMVYIAFSGSLFPCKVANAGEGDYVTIEISQISDYFATMDDTQYFIYASEPDKNSNSYTDWVFLLSEEKFKELEASDVYKYSYGEISEEPDPIKISGQMVERPSELATYISESYSYWNAAATTEDDILYYLGDFYIDQTYKPEVTKDAILNAVVMAVFAIIFLVILIRGLVVFAKRCAKVKRGKQLLDTHPEYQKAMEELDDSSTIFYKKAKTYITPHYVVTYSDGFDIVPIADITELYGYDRHNTNKAMIFSFLFGVAGYMAAGGRNDHVLVAITADGVAHEFGVLSKAIVTHSQMVANIVSKNNALTLGRNVASTSEILPYLSTLNVSQLKGFYGSDCPWIGRTNNVV